MKKAQRIDFIREIKKSLNRYLSILFIVALGVAFFSGIRSAEPDMRISVDAMADSANFMDIRVLSTMGLTEEDVEAIRQIPGITAAEGEYSLDALWKNDDNELALHVSSLPENLNHVEVTEGRLPEKSGECFLDQQLLVTEDIAVGDQITLVSGTDGDLSDSLKLDTYTVVGIGNSPYYLNFDRGTTTIGNGSLDGFVMILPEDFSMEVYTQIYAAADGLDSYVTAGNAYQEGADEIVSAVEDIAGERCEIRLADIQAEAMKEIDDAREELAAQEEEARNELADAWAQIESGEQELTDGRAEIEENAASLAEGWAELSDSESRLSGAEALLAENQASMEAGEAELAAAREQYESGKAQAEAGRASLEAARAELNARGEELASGWNSYEAGAAELQTAQDTLEGQKAQLEALRQSLEQAGLDPEENEQYVQGMAAAEAAQAQLDAQSAYLSGVYAQLTEGQSQYDQGSQTLAEQEAVLVQSEAALAEAEAQILSGEREMAAGREALAQLQAQIESGRAELESGRQTLQEGEEALAQARQELEDGEEEIAQAKADYAEAEREAEDQISDARAEIDDAQQEVEEIEMPEWYVLDRQSVQSYVEYDNDADRIGAIGTVFPVIFFLVAALVSLTTMTRMVEEKRTEIGTMKALGYSTISIASKYMLYALSASLIGSVLGFLVGEKLLPWIIITTYRILYCNLNTIRVPYDWGCALGASGAAILCTAGAALAACYKETTAQPSELMRPVAPLKGKKILLERIRPLWKHLNFSSKSTLRNLFRYKKRLLMTVFGIGACMALIIVGFGLRDSIYAVSDKQYGELWLYDASVSLEEDSSDQERQEFLEAVEADENVTESMSAYTTSMDGEANGVTKTVNLVVPDSTEEFSDFFVLRDRVGKETYALDDEGAVISEKLAKQLGIEEGDSLLLKESETESVSVPVSHITENYVYHYVYLTPALYETLYGQAAVSNTEYLKLADASQEQGEALSGRLLTCDAVAGVSLVSDMNQTILDMLGSLDTVVWVLIISAGLLAFVVLYNLNNINITERRRELATIRLLGFYDLELAMYVYRENILLTLIGIVAGIFMGNVLHRFVIETVEVDLIMFGRVIHPVSYLWGILLTFLFAFIVNVAMFYKLRKIDMVESLKSVE